MNQKYKNMRNYWTLLLVCLHAVIGMNFLIIDTEAREEWVVFEKTVRPILEKHCAECHSGDKRKGGFSMNTRETILNGSETEEVIIPGSPEESLFMDVILESDPEFRMPPEEKPPLTLDEISSLKNWIKDGLVWPEGFTLGKTSRRAPLGLKKIELPFPRSEIHPIDQLIISHLGKSGKSISERTQWNKWLRKVSLDIIGLLPQKDFRNKFQNKGWDAASEVVDYLLDQDEDYAGHWLSYWNDWLRNDYKGTGFIDGGRKQITEWLYSSLHNNKPYDKFVTELLTSAPGAEGYLHGIKWRGTVNDSQRREMQSAQSISQVFLGTNLKCASCHDSFINDWKLKEAYGFASVFADKPLELHRCDKPTGRFIKASFLYPELGDISSSLNKKERLIRLAELITSPENGRFPRTIVNRFWAHFLGKGIIEPVDDMDQLPFSEDLLDWLATELQRNNYDLKSIIRLIATSRIYQADSISPEEQLISGPVTRRLSAEQFIDAVASIVDVSLEFENSALKMDGRGQGGQIRAIGSALPRKESLSESIPIINDKSYWVWTSKNAHKTAPAGETVKIRKAFRTDFKVVKASFIATADNKVIAYVNGQMVGKSDDWNTPLQMDVGKFLKIGENTIELVASNGGNSENPAAVIGGLNISGKKKGQSLYFGTDNTWQIVSDAKKSLYQLGGSNMNPWRIKDKITKLPEWNKPKRIRASYLFTDELARAMGRPSREQIVTQRESTATTLELLELTNGKTLDAILKKGATELAPAFTEDSSSAIEKIFLKVFNRQPSKIELATSQSILGLSPTTEKVQDFFWILIMQPEFQLLN